MKKKTGKKDRLIQCVAAEGMFRVTLIEGTKLVREARKIHGLSRVATAALGRQLMMTAMMAADLKHEDDKVSTILNGDGPAGSMICTGNAALEVKGSVPNGISELPPTPEGKLDVGGFVGHTGKLTVVSDMGLKEPYVGVSNLVSGEIAVDFAQYYAASLQRPALIYLGVRLNAESGEVLSAGGVFAEPMPGCPEELLDRLQQKSAEIVTLSKQLDAGETAEAFLRARVR
jgi:molecular chaperone Hsp33